MRVVVADDNALIREGLAALLREIGYASSATVTLAYRRAEVPHPLDGFGFVVPHTEGRAILAGTFSSVKYPGRAPEGFVLMRAFVGGALGADALEGSDEDVAARARRDLGAALGVTAEPVLTRVHRHPASMPQYLVGHLHQDRATLLKGHGASGEQRTLLGERRETDTGQAAQFVGERDGLLGPLQGLVVEVAQAGRTGQGRHSARLFRAAGKLLLRGSQVGAERVHQLRVLQIPGEAYA